MRQLVVVVSLLVVVFVTALTVAAGGRPDEVRTVFAIEGMHCDSCSSAITASLEKMDGVSDVTADHEKGFAEVTYRPRKIEVEALKTEIEKLGYTVTGMDTEAVES